MKRLLFIIALLLGTSQLFAQKLPKAILSESVKINSAKDADKYQSLIYETSVAILNSPTYSEFMEKLIAHNQILDWMRKTNRFGFGFGNFYFKFCKSWSEKAVYLAACAKYAIDHDVEGERPVAEKIHLEGMKGFYRYFKQFPTKMSRKMKKFMANAEKGDFTKYPT